MTLNNKDKDKDKNERERSLASIIGILVDEYAATNKLALDDSKKNTSIIYV